MPKVHTRLDFGLKMEKHLLKQHVQYMFVIQEFSDFQQNQTI